MQIKKTCHGHDTFQCYKTARYKAVPHFVSETFAMSAYSAGPRSTGKAVLQNDDDARVALQKYRTLKGIKKGIGPMSVMGLKQIMQKFKTTGSFDM